MAVELIVTEPFAHPETRQRYAKGALIRGAEEMAWAQAHFPSHVMRKFYEEPVETEAEPPGA